MRKIKNEHEAEICRLYTYDNILTPKLGRMFGVDYWTIYQVLKRNGTSQSCGCLNRENIIKIFLNSGVNYTNRVFGNLTVSYEVERNKRGQRQVMAQCSCPDKTIKEYRLEHLKSGYARSCGCYRQEIIKEKNTHRVKDYQEKYPLFCKVEEIMDDPDGYGILVRCKHSDCNEWFSPSISQIRSRLCAIENPISSTIGTENNFYCSKECKNSCSLYRTHSDPFKDTESKFTQAELNIFSEEVKFRQREEFGYNFCEYGNCETPGPYHAHHERPKSVEWIFGLDPDNGVIFCSEHHYSIGHSGECSTGSLANKICNKEDNH